MASGFGDRLRQAREEQRMSIDQVARRLNLKPAIIQALEKDQYQHLPSAAYVRGYLRNYARLMRLDAEAFGFVHNEGLEGDEALIHPFSGLGTQETVGDGWVFKIAGYLIVGALGFWVVSWWQTRWNDGIDKTISLENLTTEEGSPALEIDLGEPRTEKIAADEKAKVSEGSKTQTADKMSPPDVVGTRQKPPPQNTKPPPRRIEIQPMKEAWIEITDAAKNSLFYGLVKPGKAVSISGEQPFKLVVGNASEVSVRYDGERIDINQFMHRGVARFTLNDKGAHP